MMKTVNLYIESNIKGGRKQDGHAGYVLEFIPEEGEAKTKERIAPVQHMTANETAAAVLKESIHRVKPNTHVEVFTDNGYIVGTINKNLKVWASHGWKTTRGEEIKNKGAWREIWILMEDISVHANLTNKHPYKSWMQNFFREQEERQCFLKNSANLTHQRN